MQNLQKGADEDMVHALIKCSIAQSFWTEARKWLNVKLPQLHLITWCKDILCDTRINEGDRPKIITVMWAIWTSRNNITHDKESMHPGQPRKLIREALMLLELPDEHTRIMPGYGWRPPDPEWLKINTGASVSLTENRSGAGVLQKPHPPLLLPGASRTIMSRIRSLQKH